MSGQLIDCIADTSAIIGLSRRDRETIQVIGNRNYAIAFVTLAELAVGVLKANKQDTALAKIEGIIKDRSTLPVSRMTHVFYAGIYCDLEQRGVMIPTNDIWIAALAVESDLPLVARDKHFSRIQGLDVIPC